MTMTKQFLLIGAVIATAFYIYMTYPHYFIFTLESYGSRYWPMHWLLFTHIMAGLMALLIGPWQFFQRGTNHKVRGYVYLTCISIGAISALCLANRLSNPVAISFGLMTLACLWLMTAGMALWSIRKNRFSAHKTWMVRNYILTFAFTSSRFIHSLLIDLHLGSPLMISIVMTWGGWLVPLVIHEWRVGGWRLGFLPKEV